VIDSLDCAHHRAPARSQAFSGPTRCCIRGPGSCLIFIIFVTLVEIPALVLLAIWFILQFIPHWARSRPERAAARGRLFRPRRRVRLGLAVAGVILSVTGGRDREEPPRLPVY
jgi:hypothetical protein